MYNEKKTKTLVLSNDLNSFSFEHNFKGQEHDV